MQGSEQTPKAPLGNNARPLQPLHHRTIRTNIDFNSKVKHLINLFIIYRILCIYGLSFFFVIIHRISNNNKIVHHQCIEKCIIKQTNGQLIY